MSKRIPMLNKYPDIIHGESHPKRSCYFIVKYGDTLRWTGKHYDVREACHEAFGISSQNMIAWNLGSDLQQARKLAKGIS